MELNLFSFVFFMLFCKVKTKLQNSFLCIFIYFTAHSGLFGPVVKRLWIICVTANCPKMRSVTS